MVSHTGGQACRVAEAWAAGGRGTEGSRRLRRQWRARRPEAIAQRRRADGKNWNSSSFYTESVIESVRNAIAADAIWKFNYKVIKQAAVHTKLRNGSCPGQET